MCAQPRRSCVAATWRLPKVKPIIIPVSPVSQGLPLLPWTALKQTPFALVLGCSDARAPVEAIFD